MKVNRFMQGIVLLVTILVLALWQSAAAQPPELPNNPGIPGLLAEIEELNAEIEVLEAVIEHFEDFAPVPKTGQTQCWDSSGFLIDCGGTGQDGDIQRGTPSPDPRFTDNLDGTVTDNLTGLVWLKKANCFGIRSWDDALSASNGLKHGDCGLDDGSIAGDWTLPNVKKLQSLIVFSNMHPALPVGHPFEGVMTDAYWSSTTQPQDGFGGRLLAAVVSLNEGSMIWSSKATLPYAYVWPVRDPR